MASTRAPISATFAEYEAKVERLRGQYQQIPAGAPVRLAKRTSNLFRSRAKSTAPGLDVAAFDGVIDVDANRRTADVMGMTTYEHLVDATLPHGLMPLVVPQLKTITLGGAVTGLGIESSSFRDGLPHESVLEMDVLTGDGEVLTVTNQLDDPYRDLYLSFPNSYGSLGYALRLKIELTPVSRFVLLRHVRFDTAERLTASLASITETREYEGESVDFLDGAVFSPTEQYLTLGRWSEVLPEGRNMPSDYTDMDIYYRSIQHRHTDVLTARDYIWRWDTDWFWCSRAFGAQRPAIRKLWPKTKLRSDVYWKIIAADRRWRFSDRQAQLFGKPQREEVVQDIEVPITALPDFLEFFHREIGIEPIWVCPLRSRDGQTRWPLYDLNPHIAYVNVGFWSTVELPTGIDATAGHFNRMIEAEVTKLGGHKSLYSSAYYNQEQFDDLYGGPAYRDVKKRYDAEGRLLGLFEKVVQRR
ncbi:MAG: FAD-binding oxidoreductase [Candidatus Nanopelagicales bacterium]